MNIHDDKKLFSDLLLLVSDYYKINSGFVEKDYYAIGCLKKIITINPNLVFKGGTSLSKCNKIIKRFSEDIDISYNKEHLSISQRRNLVYSIKDCIHNFGLEYLNPESIRSKRLFNRYICPYNTLVLDTPSIKPYIQIELALQSPSFPIVKMKVQTFIGQYLDEIGKSELCKQYDLNEFEVNTQTIERTFVDKIFALCDYFLRKDTKSESRHIYDLHMLFPLIKKDKDLFSLFEEVRQYRINQEFCPSANPAIKLSDVMCGYVEDGFYKKDYNNATYTLLFEKVTYEEAISSIKKIADYLKENNL